MTVWKGAAVAVSKVNPLASTDMWQYSTLCPWSLHILMNLSYLFPFRCSDLGCSRLTKLFDQAHIQSCDTCSIGLDPVILLFL